MRSGLGSIRLSLGISFLRSIFPGTKLVGAAAGRLLVVERGWVNAIRLSYRSTEVGIAQS